MMLNENSLTVAGGDPPPGSSGQPPFTSRPTKYCSICGSIIDAMAELCPKCGVRQPGVPAQRLQAMYPTSQPKSKIIAALLALFVGHLGIHKFYLNDNKAGAIMLVTWIVSIPLLFVLVGFIGFFVLAIWALVNFVQLLIMDDSVFNDRYNKQLSAGPYYSAPLL